MVDAYKLDTHEDRVFFLSKVFNLSEEDILNLLVNRAYNNIFDSSAFRTLLFIDYPKQNSTYQANEERIACDIVGLSSLDHYAQKLKTLCTLTTKSLEEFTEMLVSNVVLDLKNSLLSWAHLSPKKDLNIVDIINGDIFSVLRDASVPSSSIHQTAILTEKQYSQMSDSDKDDLRSHLRLLKKITDELVLEEDRDSWPKPDSF